MQSGIQEVLDEALDDEYMARATYRAVLEAFGPVRPFVNIVEAESRHAEALLALYEQFGLEAPDDQWAGEVEPPSTLAIACERAAEAERENAAMYDRLLAATAEPDVRRVLGNLQRASEQNHLPAFERCVARETRPGASASGRGLRRHGRRRRRRGLGRGSE